MDRITNFLAATEAEQLKHLWTDMFFHEATTSLLAVTDKTLVVQFLNKGVSLQPSWTPTKCAVAIERITGTTMAAEDSLAYSHAFIYSLALLCEVDPGKMTLSDKQVEVAFKLAKAWKAHGKRSAAGGPGGAAEMDADAEAQATDSERESADTDEDDGVWEPLDWEVAKTPLPSDLAQVLTRAQQGLLQLDARGLLESLPPFQDLKEKAETNNHRADQNRVIDKTLRHLQQRVLSFMRIFVVLHGHVNAAGVSLSQQAWALLCLLEAEVVKERKKASLPAVVNTVDQPLFSVEDLKSAEEQKKINRAEPHGYTGYGGFGGTSPEPKNCEQIFRQISTPSLETFSSPGHVGQETSCVLPSPGRGIKFRNYQKGHYRPGYKGFGKGKGKPGKGRGGGKPCTGPAAISRGGDSHSAPQQPHRQDPQWPAAQSIRGCHQPSCQSEFSKSLSIPRNGFGKMSVHHNKKCVGTNDRGSRKWVGDTHLPHRLRLNLQWWEKWASPKIVNLIKYGIKPQWQNPPSLSVQGRQGENLEQARKILEDYEKSGAVRRVNPQGTQHLLPWFLISKPEDGEGSSAGSSPIVGR